MRGTIYSVDHDEDIWSAGDAELLTRGLAVSRESIAVGLSEFTARSERASSDGGVALVDRATLRTRESLWFSGIGNVHEVRLVDDVDQCHAAGPATSAVLELIDTWQEQGRSREIAPRAKRGFIASASVSSRLEPVTPSILEFNGGAQMSIDVMGPANARVVTRRIGDSNLMLSRAHLDGTAGGMLLSARAWCMVEHGAQDAYARLRLCFLDAQGGYLSEHEARSEPAGLGEARRHWLELMAVAPPDKRVKSAELMWLQSGDAEVYLRACSFSTMPVPGSPRKAKALPVSF
jgi:hypothetical protein